MVSAAVGVGNGLVGPEECTVMCHFSAERLFQDFESGDVSLMYCPRRRDAVLWSYVRDAGGHEVDNRTP